MSVEGVTLNSAAVPSSDRKSHRVPMAWQVELWKLFRQLWPLAALSMVVVGILQVWLEMNTFPGQSSTVIFYFAGYFSAVIFLTGAMLVTVGMEREQRQWDWVASLPTPWWQNLLLKTAMVTLGFVICLLTNGLVARLLHALSDRPDLSTDQLQSLSRSMQLMFAGVVTLGPVFLLTLLAIRRLEVAITVAVASIMLLIFTAESLFYGLEMSVTQAIRTEVILAIVLHLAVIGTYRWRWRTGLFDTTGGWSSSAASATTAPVRIAGQVSSWRAQLILAMKQQGWIWLAMLTFPIGAWVTLFWVDTSSGPPSAEFGLNYTIVLLTYPLFLIGGIRAFAADRSMGRICMWGDFGASPWTIWLTRVGPWLGVTAISLAILAGTRPIIFEPVATLGVLSWITLLMIFACVGLISRLAVNSWVTALAVMSCLAIVWILLLTVQFRLLGVMGWIVMAGVLLLNTLVFSYWMVRQLLKSAEPRMGRLVTGYVIATVLLTLVFDPMLRVAAIPVTQLPKDTEQQLQNLQPVGLPDFRTLGLPEISEQEMVLGAMLFRDGLIDDQRRKVVFDRGWDPQWLTANPEVTEFLRSEPLSEEQRKRFTEATDLVRLKETLSEIERRMQDKAVQSMAGSWDQLEQPYRRTKSWLAFAFAIQASLGQDEAAIQSLETYQELSSGYLFSHDPWHHDYSVLSILPDSDWQRILQKMTPEQRQQLLQLGQVRTDVLENQIWNIYKWDRQLPPVIDRQAYDSAIKLHEWAELEVVNSRLSSQASSSALPRSMGFVSSMWRSSPWEQARARRLADRGLVIALRAVRDGRFEFRPLDQNLALWCDVTSDELGPQLTSRAQSDWLWVRNWDGGARKYLRTRIQNLISEMEGK